MANKKFKRIMGCILCVFACSFVLFGCSEESPKGAVITYPKDISAIAGFQCVCSTDDETEFIIENDDAKELYTYIMEQWGKAEQTEDDRTEQDCIFLSFQDGEARLALSQKTNAERLKEHFYGEFWICENDYMVYTAMPTTSFQIHYKMPGGTYERISEMIAK